MPLFRLAVASVVTGALVVPILAGLWQTWWLAAGGVGGQAGFAPLWSTPGLWASFRLTLFTGTVATALSLLLAAALATVLHDGRGARLLAPLLAIPHAAIAIGLAFVLAPSGWIVRLISPWATGWSVPPDVATVGDPLGLSLIVGLVVKEVPFLTLVILAALGRIPVARDMAAGRALGYAKSAVWARVILPQVWPLIRLPVLVVLSFSLSVVDMALILGPGTPPPLTVAMMRWFLSPAPGAVATAAAAAILLTATVVGAIALARVSERAIALAGRGWLYRGVRAGVGEAVVLRGSVAIGLALAALAVLALVSLSVWSVAWRWPYPAPLPTEWSIAPWSAAQGWPRTLGRTALIAALSTTAAIVLAIAWLESTERQGRLRGTEVIIYLPLIVPQIAFLFGLQVTALRAGIAGGLFAVVWGHAIFVFPYVMIVLADPWRRLDPGLARAAAALGAGPWRRLFAVKLPVLLAPLLTAAAIGVAVSVAQYLPTLFLGEGRIRTLTTEAVTLASGADRRITAVFAALQAGLPLLAYATALVLPAIVWRNRAGLRGRAR